MQDDRDTVRRQDSQHESGSRRHQPVGQRYRVRGRAGAPTAMLVGHDSDIRTVRLRAEDEVVQGGAECRGRSYPVRQHGGIVVPDPQAQIERGTATAGNPAAPGGDENIHQPLVKARPTQYLQAGRCSAKPRRRHAGGHLPRPRQLSAFNVGNRPFQLGRSLMSITDRKPRADTGEQRTPAVKSTPVNSARLPAAPGAARFEDTHQEPPCERNSA